MEPGDIGKITQIYLEKHSYHILRLIKGSDRKGIMNFYIWGKGQIWIAEMKTSND